MIVRAFARILGNRNSRELARMGKQVRLVNELAKASSEISAADFPARTQALKARYANGERLEQLLPTAFALVREAADRTIQNRHFDVQLIGGMTLHEGRIAEMRTGEGKTLVATLAAVLNALTGKGVHVVTVNDYLARRDADWMGPIYRYLGLSVGVIQSGQSSTDKHAAYACDITYGNNNEFGFDYLRDNMALRLQDQVQRDRYFAIVDEVDSILIDEARTPLIIAGAAERRTELYQVMDRLAPRLKQQEMVESRIPVALGGEPIEDTGDFFVDEKNRRVELTERGHERVEAELRRLNLLESGDTLYSAANLRLLELVTAALRAHFLYKRDVEYVVKDGQIVIIDEHTGRAMPGRRWSEGLHQAVEAKEGVAIRDETQTVASTTFQNYFRLYDKLAGMTGTAETEAMEFRQIYGLDVIVIPTHRLMIRDDRNDLIFNTLAEKYDAVVQDVMDCVERGQPVLVGTASIESSESLSAELRKNRIAHNVLNAKQHEREAEVVAQAGRAGNVTIATKMAGRGTDIKLGGNWEAEVARMDTPTESEVAKARDAWSSRHNKVLEAGGLHIIGSERHESRRIDNQLRGRSGRQGDPGSSRFYLSMEHDLMRIFVSERMRNMIAASNVERGQAIEAGLVNKSIERAQRKVEGRNFDIRKSLLEYDDVSNDQRQVVYHERSKLLEVDDVTEMIESMRAAVLQNLVDQHLMPQVAAGEKELTEIGNMAYAEFGIAVPVKDWLDDESVALDREQVASRLVEASASMYRAKTEEWIEEGIDVRSGEKRILLSLLDQKWKEHLATMDQLRQAIHLRAYAQKQPKQEYKRESFELFEEMLFGVQFDTIRTLSRLRVQKQRDEEEERKRQLELMKRLRLHHASSPTSGSDLPSTPRRQTRTPVVREGRKIGRNEQCPCGSGKKYKRCCGVAA
ncbi:MAG: preprotein translocase subunit SecA [Pseudomonadales bacterium]|nr:preprotein translocase subunit SecA [Pseudomonadales bacterium]